MVTTDDMMCSSFQFKCIFVGRTLHFLMPPQVSARSGQLFISLMRLGRYFRDAFPAYRQIFRQVMQVHFQLRGLALSFFISA